jgi:hypothetical protein
MNHLELKAQLADAAEKRQIMARVEIIRNELDRGLFRIDTLTARELLAIIERLVKE